MDRRGILTEYQREQVRKDYRDLTWDPHKMQSDIKNQIKSFKEDLAILKEHEEDLYQLVIEAVDEVREDP